MGKFKAVALTFPLVEERSNINDALKLADRHSIHAVVSTNGTTFWLHNKSDLVNAAKQSPSKTLDDFQNQELSVLNHKEVGKLGLDLTILDESQVRKYFPTPGVDAIVTSVVSNLAGDRMVVALANPDGAFRVVVGKVWVCPHPNGGERYRAPGICSAHGVKLVPES
jgi:hypothetical protein